MAGLRKKLEESKAEYDELHKKLADPNILPHMIGVFQGLIKFLSEKLMHYERELSKALVWRSESKQNSISI